MNVVCGNSAVSALSATYAVLVAADAVTSLMTAAELAAPGVVAFDDDDDDERPDAAAAANDCIPDGLFEPVIWSSDCKKLIKRSKNYSRLMNCKLCNILKEAFI
ncbi:unnamed protein product [Strongylus vulgaris]|uniref:Uncharacterized protein n=1 Tax=Strongylus vulgaris TaxID=40348 RepID=A0A3P7IN67_STRVU|nr:unnamed protein product [Strongylus vulgaris]